MKRLALFLFLCLLIRGSLQKKSKTVDKKCYTFELLLQTLIYIPQANLHGHAPLPVASSVLCHLWIRGVLSHTRHALQQPTPEAVAGVLPGQHGLMEENSVTAVEIMDGITVTQKMPTLRSRKMSHLAAHMVRVKNQIKC